MSNGVAEDEVRNKIGWPGVAAAAVGLVVASTTFAGNFNGFGTAGPAYVIAILVGFALNLFVMWAYAELTTMFPKAGQIYEFTKRAFEDGRARKWGVLLAAGAGTSYWLIFGLVFAAEGSAGASAMVSTTGVGSVVGWIVAINVISLILNLLGVRISMLVELVLVITMVGVRVLFGLAGFTGLNNVGAWHIDPILNFTPFGWGAVFGTLTLGFWAFVGLEFATPLVEETKNPEKNIPKGMFIGILVILAMGLIMGFGTIGVIDPATHQELYTGNAPQIEIGGMLLGPYGAILAGIASFAATLGSVNVAYASIPRIIQAMAREGLWPDLFAWEHPQYGSPWPATILTFFLFLVPTVLSHEVVPLIDAATVVWLLAYIWIFGLALKLRTSHIGLTRPFSVNKGIYFAGIFLILFVLWRAYQGAYWLVGLGLAIAVVGFIYAFIWTSYTGTSTESVASAD